VRMYVMKAGENLQQIAAKKNIPFRTVLDANPELATHNDWPAGTKVRLPAVILKTSNEESDQESNEAVQKSHHSHQLASYYEHQKRWLEQLHRYQKMYEDQCLPHMAFPYHETGRREANEERGERDERGEHDEHGERERHERREGHEKHEEHSVKKTTKPKSKKRLKRKKHKRNHWGRREHHHPQEEVEQSERECPPEEPRLPWLNV
jgi:hypothetical protein